ncbi:MAG TPA: nucleotide exchange factor GrpE [Ktedonobacterales bacterium]
MDEEMTTAVTESLATDEEHSQAEPEMCEAQDTASPGDIGAAGEATVQNDATVVDVRPRAAPIDGPPTDIATLRSELVGLRRDFQSKLMYDEGKQRQLDTLHQELESYRRGFHFQTLRPVLTDLITLYGDVEKVSAHLAQQEQAADAARELAHVRDQIEEILRRNGVERFTVSGAEFDARRQRVVAFVETNDPAQDKRIAEHLRPGFEYEGRIITQLEQVSAYRFVAAPAEERD